MEPERWPSVFSDSFCPRIPRTPRTGRATGISPSGARVSSVSTLAKTTAGDAKTIHARPALMQELEWRPQYVSNFTASSADPVQKIVFSFYNDQLSKMVVDYDRDRTAGMTGGDIIEALSISYGPADKPVLRTARTTPTEIDGESSVAIARWGDADYAVVLYRADSSYGSTASTRFQLVVSSPRLDALAHTAAVQAAPAGSARGAAAGDCAPPEGNRRRQARRRAGARGKRRRLPALSPALDHVARDRTQAPANRQERNRMATDIVYGDASRQSILRGVNRLANAVKVTLGPRGRNVIIGSRFGSPTITKDGVTVAKEIDLRDSLENMGAQMVKEVAARTSDIAGDGTTTATVLAQAIYREGARNVTAGANPMALKRGIGRAVEVVVDALRAQSKPVSGPMIAQVGTISANHDETIGRIIAEAMEKVGKDGVITVEEGKTLETTLDVVEGMQFDRGYLSPYFVTDPERMEAVLENAVILVHEKKIGAMKDLLPLLELVAKADRPLLIVAEDIDGEALATLVVNKLRGTLRVVAVKAPGYGEGRRWMLEDLAVLTGAKAVTEDLGVSARVDDARESGQRQEDHGRQGQDDDHRGRRRARGHRWPDQDAPDPYRGRHI